MFMLFGSTKTRGKKKKRERADDGYVDYRSLAQMMVSEDD